MSDPIALSALVTAEGRPDPEALSLCAEPKGEALDGLGPEATTLHQEAGQTHTLSRWQATLPGLAAPGAPGGLAALTLTLPADALPPRAERLHVGAGLHWESLDLDPVGREGRALTVTLELDLDGGGQWSGAIELIALEPKEATHLADADIFNLPGCEGLPPMRHVLYRVGAGATFSRMKADDGAWSGLHKRRSLLFIHGTGLPAEKTLRFMEGSSGGLVSELVARYGGRVLAFNHSTVFSSVEGNLAALAGLWPAHDPLSGEPLELELDVLAVSRGGLVARALIEGHGPSGGPRLRFREVVFLGTPNDGTWSAVGNNTHCVLGVRCLCHQGDALPGAPPEGDPIARGDVGKGQPGAVDQQPGSDFLRRLNGGEGPALTSLHPGLRYRAVSSTVWLPPDHPKRDCVDKMFGAAENDLVVPVASVFTPAVAAGARFEGLLPVTPERRLHFPPHDLVTHVDYINQPRVHAALREWLPGALAATV